MNKFLEQLHTLKESGYLDKYQLNVIEVALEEHEKEIRNKTIEEFSEKIKTIYHFTLLELEELDELIEEMRNVK